MHVCTQFEGWVDNRRTKLREDKICKPYVKGTTKSALLLDQMKSHAHPMFIDSVDEIGHRIIGIPGVFTWLRLPCDVGIIKPFKTRFVKLFQQLKLDEYTRLGGSSKISRPGRKSIRMAGCYLERISYWGKQNLFLKCGLTENLDIHVDLVLDFIIAKSTNKFKLMVYILPVRKYCCIWTIAQ